MCKGAETSIIMKNSLDRSLWRKKMRQDALSFLPISRRYMRLFFEKQVARRFVRPRRRTLSRTFLLRPRAADRRMRFSCAPAYPSRNYLGRESSSLPRSFSSLLAIRGGAHPPPRKSLSRPFGAPRAYLTKPRLRNTLQWHAKHISCAINIAVYSRQKKNLKGVTQRGCAIYI